MKKKKMKFITTTLLFMSLLGACSNSNSNSKTSSESYKSSSLKAKKAKESSKKKAESIKKAKEESKLLNLKEKNPKAKLHLKVHL